ncbi:hypothetical protein M406DRAFT_270053 [Cryphonectria parasitica EP155]|uniref:Xylanolytic transcriptional activator regulatory domain-containing protein n=1 Tax=Cryphonectria parasitica (strain ATCC 38755 / EP155) TaxID=660469 RepID=A0A9P4XSI7_CRYP1|nr:uncharacterized protein M406DRAFT_270053 [Cryphonectria parasitica EP155]KAF3759930.1 hypothetical protein M406DRAFT_270053 [Cryphonectria parasitica EP155]
MFNTNLPSHPTSRQVMLLGKDISNIFSTLQRVCDKLSIEPPWPLMSTQGANGAESHLEQQSAEGTEEAGEDGTRSGVYELSPPASPSAVQAPIDPYLSGGNIGADASLTAGTGTGGHGSPAQRVRGRESERGDLVSKGIITPERAEMLVKHYLLYLDRFLYGIAGHYRDAHQVRMASPTLFAAMCAVAAFQDVDNKDLFDQCYKEYRSLVSTSLFEKRDLEYIRALCIGSFWLLDTSRILLSDAVRRAADSRLHHYFHRWMDYSSTTTTTSKVPTASFEDARDRVRLWYLLFVSDRHLSILHNRDALTRQEKDAIENRDSFLASENAGSSLSNLDIRLISQVSLLVIMGQIRDVLGCERPRPLPKTFVIQFSHFTNDLDQWYGKYSPSFEPDEHIGDFPLAGLTIHYQYARLYLNHHVFQGLDDKDPIPVHFLPAAAAAREAAHRIFSMLIENPALRSNIVGMPHYFHIMISFAGHCLLEMAMKHREQLGIAVEDDFGRIAAVLTLFASTSTLPQHPIARALAGLTRKLNECTASLGMESVLTGSPFQKAEYTNLMADFGGGMGGGEGGANSGGSSGNNGEVIHAMFTSPGNMQTFGGLSDDFWYGDFGDFHLAFPASQSQL